MGNFPKQHEARRSYLRRRLRLRLRLAIIELCVEMWATLTSSSIRILLYRSLSLPPVPIAAASPLLTSFRTRPLMEPHNTSSSSFSAFSHSSRSGGGGRSMEMKDYNRERPKGRGGGGGKDKIDALGRLLTRILRHMASELKLNMRGDGFVKVEDLLELNLRTFADIPLRSHTVDDIR